MSKIIFGCFMQLSKHENDMEMPKLLHRIFISVYNIVFDIKSIVSVTSSVLYTLGCVIFI